jgi:hypothetical protein
MSRSAKTLFLSFLLLLLAIMFACSKKRVIVVPEACLTSDRTEILAGDTVLFTDCSIAEQSQLLIYEGDTRPSESPTFLFDSDRHYKHGFHQLGDFTAEVWAINPNAPIKMQKIKIVVTER